MSGAQLLVVEHTKIKLVLLAYLVFQVLLRLICLIYD